MMEQEDNFAVDELISKCNERKGVIMNKKNGNSEAETGQSIENIQITFSIRMPLNIKNRITALAKKDQRSMNFMITKAVEEKLQREE